MKQELFTLPEHLSSPQFLVGFVLFDLCFFCVVFCRSLFVPLFFFFWPLCCLSLFFWPLCCLSLFFWPLCCLSFFFWPLCCLSFFDVRILINPSCCERTINLTSRYPEKLFAKRNSTFRLDMLNMNIHYLYTNIYLLFRFGQKMIHRNLAQFVNKDHF